MNRIVPLLWRQPSRSAFGFGSASVVIGDTPLRLRVSSDRDGARNCCPPGMMGRPSRPYWILCARRPTGPAAELRGAGGSCRDL